MDAPRRCPYCECGIMAGDHVHRCAACGTLHHLDCWHDNRDRCAVYSCQGRQHAAQAQVEIHRGDVIEVQLDEEPPWAPRRPWAMPPRRSVPWPEIAGAIAALLMLLIALPMLLGNRPHTYSYPPPAAYSNLPPPRPDVPEVKAFKVGDRRDAKTKRITHETTSFRAGAKLMYVGVVLGPSTQATQVKVVLTAIYARKASGESLTSEDVAQAGGVGLKAGGGIAFKLAGPKTGWPAGLYEVRLYLGGDLVDVRQVTVGSLERLVQ